MVQSTFSSTSRPPKARTPRTELRKVALELLQTEVKFIYCDEFKSMSPGDPRALELKDRSSNQVLDSGNHRETHDSLTCLGSALSGELLGAAAEVHEFRRMNYLKYAANCLRAEIDPQKPSARHLSRIQQLLDEARAVRDHILQSNLRLVAANAGKYRSNGYGFEDLFSDGVVSLVDAIEKFDYSRGFRFSTYATHCIRRSYFRRIERHQKQQKRFRATAPDVLHAVPDRSDPAREQPDASDLLVRKILERFPDVLNERERLIVEGRFGLGDRQRPHTLIELSGELGICKERVRQIEHRAVDKIRKVAFELMHGRELSAEGLSA